MTYEQALQIAIEQLDDAVDYLKAMNKGFPKWTSRMWQDVYPDADIEARA